MTEEQLKEIVALQKTVTDTLEATTKTVKSEEFKSLDGLNKDLLITEVNALQTLLGVLSIRIGLNIASVQQARLKAAQQQKEKKETPEDKTAHEQTEPTSEKPEPEEPVSGQE